MSEKKTDGQIYYELDSSGASMLPWVHISTYWKEVFEKRAVAFKALTSDLIRDELVEALKNAREIIEDVRDGDFTITSHDISNTISCINQTLQKAKKL